MCRLRRIDRPRAVGRSDLRAVAGAGLAQTCGAGTRGIDRRRPVAYAQSSTLTDSPRYQLLRRIAGGGSAEIFEAVFERAGGFRRHVAIKRLLPELARDPSAVDAFLDEARLGELLAHRHIASVVDFGALDGIPVQVLELIDGLDLARLVDLQGPGVLPLLPALEVAAAVTDALSYAHQLRDEEGSPLGIVHRDVAPDNVLVSWEGDVKLVDFGIALAHGRRAKTSVGIIKGKLSYMAPEQFEARDVDARADVFGVGCLLHFLLTGASVIKDRALLNPGRITVSPDLPAGAAALVSRATQADRSYRYPSAAALLEDLEALISVERAGGAAESLRDLVKGTRPTRVARIHDDAPGTLVSAMNTSLWDTGETSLGPQSLPTSSAPEVASPPWAARSSRSISATGSGIRSQTASDGDAGTGSERGLGTGSESGSGNRSETSSEPGSGIVSESTNTDEIPPALGGTRTINELDRVGDVVVLRGEHAQLNTPRTVVLVLSRRWGAVAVADLCRRLAAVRDPGLLPLLDFGVDDRGRAFLIHDGIQATQLVEVVDPSMAQDRSLVARWMATTARVDGLLRSVGLASSGALLRYSFVPHAGTEPVVFLPLNVLLADEVVATLPTTMAFLDGLTLEQVALPSGSRANLQNVIAAGLLAVGLAVLGASLLLTQPSALQRKGSTTVYVVQRSPEPEPTMDPTIEPARSALAEPTPTPSQPSTPRGASKVRPRRTEAPTEPLPHPTESVEVVARELGLLLEDIRLASVDPDLDAYQAAAKRNDPALIEAVAPRILQRLRTLRLDDALVGRRLERVRRVMVAKLSQLPAEQRPPFERAFLDIKAQAEPDLEPAKARELLLRLERFERSLR